jgi:hypothetical protein
MALSKEQERNQIAAAEELFGYCPCMHCTRFDLTDEDSDEVKCEAFPDGIPDEIFFGENLHKEPYPGDKGLMFEEEDETKREVAGAEGEEPQEGEE